MPVAGSIKLDLIADANDRASATLRAVQAELKKTEERAREAAAATREDADISDILARGSGKARAALAAEVDAREKAVQKRREMVEAAREAARATEGEAGMLGKLKGKIDDANRAKEMFNKTLGVAGFVGAAVGALAALGDWIDGLSDYRVALEETEQKQERFNELVRGLGGAVREDKLARMTELERGLFLAQERLNEAVDANVELQGQIEQRKGLIAEADERIKELGAGIFLNAGKIFDNLKAIEEIENTNARLATENEEAKRQQGEHQEVLNRLLKEATPEYQAQQLAMRGIADEHARFLGDIAAYKQQQEDAAKRQMEAGANATKPPKPTGGGGSSARQQTREEGIDAVLGGGKWAPAESKLAQIVDDGLEDPSGMDLWIAKLEELTKRSERAKESVRQVFDTKRTEEASSFADEVDNVAAAIGRLGDIGNLVLPGLGSALGNLGSTVGSFASGDIVGGIVGAIGGIADLFSGEDEKRERREREREERARAAEREREERDRRERERDRRRDARQIIIVQSREGIIYGLGADVARAASRTAEALDGTGMSNGRF